MKLRNLPMPGYLRFSVALLLLPCLFVVTAAQETSESERDRALRLLWKESKASAALPLLEKLAKERPDDGPIAFSYGFALLAKMRLLKDPEERRQTRIESRRWLVKAADLGVDDPLLKNLLETLPEDGGKDDVFSSIKGADEAMREGEALYVNGKFIEAAAAYVRALQSDPKLYEAALFAGDMYFKAGDNPRAAEWFAKAVKIDPNRETAYRYSATPFMRAGKLDEAKSRYIEAVVAEPYNRLTWMGISQWAEAAGIRLGHPRIDIPTTVSSGRDNNVSITVDPRVGETKNDPTGVGAWMIYGFLRANWKLTEFAKAYPSETAYRHSLREEFSALKAVAESVKQRQKDQTITKLDPSLENLVKLYDEGLLEPFILFALADEGIARDYAEYRNTNREKLKRYLLDYVTAP